MIYLDSCALVKLVREENESAALQAWLDERGAELVVTSEIAQAEVVRVVRRNNHTDQGVLIDPEGLARELDDAADLLASVAQITLDRSTLVRAGALDIPMVRTLDAIHLASSLGLEPADADFVTYDRRLAMIARDAGLTVVALR